MPLVDSQRHNISINLNSYLQNKQILRDLLVLDNQFLYVLSDYKTKEIQAIDNSPHLLNYLRYGLPDSTVTVYPKNVDIQFAAGLTQAKLSFLKELNLLIENKLCNLIKYPPFLPHYLSMTSNPEIINQCKKFDLSPNDVVKENNFYKESYDIMVVKFQILFEYWVQRVNAVDNKQDLAKMFKLVQSRQFFETLYEPK